MDGRMHVGEVVTDVDLVRRLVAAQFPQWAGLPVVAVASGGTDNALYRLGPDLLVRLPRIGWAVGDVAKEQRWLPRLAPLLPVAIPVPSALGRPGEGYPHPWSVYGWLDGANPTPPIDSPALAAELADVVSALHRVEIDGGPRGDRGAPLADRDDDVRAAIADLAGEIDGPGVTAAWDGALRTPVWGRPPVWIHGDLSPGNLLLEGGHLRAVIDFGAVGVGDPACDLAVAWNLFAPPSRALFRAATTVDDDTWRRGRGWALSIALIQLPYYRHTSPTIADAARAVIAAVLADPG